MLRWLLALVISFAPLCQPANSVCAAESADDKKVRHHEYWGGYSVEVPDGWRVSKKRSRYGFFDIARLRPGTKDLDVLNVNRIFTAASHDKYARRMINIFTEEMKGDVRDFVISEFETNSGIKGTQLLFWVRLLDNQEHREGLFYIEVGEVLFQIDWSGPTIALESHDEEIIAIVKSFRIEDPAPQKKRADGKRRYDEPRGGYSCVPPQRWKAVDSPSGGFCVYTSPDKKIDRRVISIGRNPCKDSVKEITVSSLEMYRDIFVSHTLLEETAFTTADGLAGTRLVLNMVRKQDNAELRSVLYLFNAPTGTLECGIFGPLTDGDRYDHEYDTFANSLRLEAGEPQKKQATAD